MRFKIHQYDGRRTSTRGSSIASHASRWPQLMLFCSFSTLGEEGTKNPRAGTSASRPVAHDPAKKTPKPGVSGANKRTILQVRTIMIRCKVVQDKRVLLHIISILLLYCTVVALGSSQPKVHAHTMYPISLTGLFAHTGRCTACHRLEEEAWHLPMKTPAPFIATCRLGRRQ